MTELELPDGRIAEFPDGTPPEVMKRAAQSYTARLAVDRGVSRAALGARERSEASTGSIFADAALAGMSGEGGSFADPNATGEDLLKRASAHAAIITAANPVGAVKSLVGGLAGTAAGGLTGRTIGSGLEAAGLPEGLSTAGGRIGGAFGGFAGGLTGGLGRTDAILDVLRRSSGGVGTLARMLRGRARRASVDVAPPMAAETTVAAAAPIAQSSLPLMSRQGAVEFETLLAKALQEGRAKAALKAAGKGNRRLAESLGGVTDDDALKLLAQGKGVTTP